MDWFKTWFNSPYYHILYKNRDFQEAQNFIKLLVAELNLMKNDKVIDLACGKGRHSVFLNQLGFEVLGLDLSAQSIQHNQQFTNDKLQFKVHDMRAPIIGVDQVNAVLNLFTSFGYFSDEKDDERVFRSVYNILKEEGCFVLDFLNERYVKNTLIPKENQTIDGITFHLTREIRDNHVVKDILFTDGGEDFHFYEKVKLHTKESIEDLAKEIGFERVALFGGYKLEPFNLENSSRCISVFRKVSQ